MVQSVAYLPHHTFIILISSIVNLRNLVQGLNLFSESFKLNIRLCFL